MTLAVLGVAAGAAGVMLPSTGITWPTFGGDATESPLVAGAVSPAAPVRARNATPAAAGQASAVRRIYRHSVIPGGVADKVELAQVLRTDRLVAAHYASFNVDNARAVTVTAPRAVYVSYRKNDQIYWTSKKVMLEQGETLLTDGEHDIRARCANRISDVPQYPVETHGPSESELDTVVANADGVDAGGMLAVAADMDMLGTSEAVGQRYYTTSFANGAGLTIPLDTQRVQASTLGQAPGMPDWYNNAPVNYRGLLGGVSASDAAPATGASDSDTATPGSSPTAGSNDAPAAGGNGGDTSTGPVVAPDGSGSSGGSGNPGNTGSGGSDSGGTPGGSGGGAIEQPAAPTPSLPTPGAEADTPVITPGTPATPATPGTPGAPATPGNTVVDPAAPTEVPEPGTLWLGGIALAAMLWLRRKGAHAGR